MKKLIYEAVDRDRLIEELKGNCAPNMYSRGYVIGPSANGLRMKQISAHITMAEAERKADALNKEYSLGDYADG